MAEKILNTRIQNRIDTLAHWLDADPILKKGEIAIATVPANDENGVSTELPSVLIKVGDGQHKFSELDFIYAKAADVHEWAKAAVKPTYTAREITGLEDFIAGEIKDTNTLYKLEQDANNKRIIRLYSRAHNAAEDAEWTVVSELALEDCSALITNAINALDATVASTDVEAGKGVKVTVVETDGKLTSVSVEGNYDNAYDAKGAAEAVRGELNSYKTTNNAAIEGINNTIATLATKEELNTAKGDLNTAIGEVADDLAEHIEAQNTLNATLATKDEVKKVADDLAEHVEAQNALNATLATKDEVQAVADDLAEYIEGAGGLFATKGELQEHATAAESTYATKTALAEHVAAQDALNATYATKTELETHVNEATAILATKDELQTEVNRATEAEAALDERLDKIELFFEGAAEDEGEGESLKNALDTLKEIQDYINTDGTAADKMVEDIAANKKAVEDLAKTHADDMAAAEQRFSGIENTMATAGALAEAVAAQKLVDEAQDAKIKALEDRFEGEGSVEDLIAAAKQEAIDAAAADATTKADAAQAAAEATAATKASEAETAAKAHADTIVEEALKTASADATTKAAEAEASAKAYTDTEVAKVKAVADTAVQTVSASEGLVATRTEGSDAVNLAIDDTVTFVFNCGDAYGNPNA